MPRSATLSDLLALLDAHDQYSGGVPRSIIARRAQALVNSLQTRTGCERSQQALAARGVVTHLPDYWQRRERSLAVFETLEIPLLQNLIGTAGSLIPFLPDLIPAPMIAAAKLRSRNDGGSPPHALAARCRTAAKRARKATGSVADVFQARRFLGLRAPGIVIGRYSPPTGYALRD